MAMLRALELVRQREAGELSAETMARNILERIAEVEPTVQAFAQFDGEAMLAGAQAARAGGLHGLPVAFKDIIETSTMPTENGSPIYDGWQPRADATIVTQTLNAGGSMMGKSVTTEFAFLEPSKTFNPHNHLHTPGGSSSGSAAGVAAGMMPLAFGTQTGGSVIRPASYCGVAAIKTSFRLLPTVGIKTGAWTLDTLGLFGAEVADIAFGLAAITGRPLRVDGRSPGTPRFAVDRMPFAGAATDEAENALKAAISALERAGAVVMDRPMPEVFHSAHEAHPTLYNYEAGAALAWEITHHRDKLSRILLEHFAPKEPIPHEIYDEARGIAKKARRAAKDWFGGFDALLTFSAPGPAPDRSTTGTATFNRLFTLLGTPCVNVPGYKTGSGLPVGVQVVAAFGADYAALAAADFLEKALRRHLG